MSNSHKEKNIPGDQQVIHHLQVQIKSELMATNQQLLHYRVLKHWGFDRLAEKKYEKSIGEMKHADRSIEPILLPDGRPSLQDLAKLQRDRRHPLNT